MLSRVVGNDYVDFLYEHYKNERYLYPFKNYGFNMSFVNMKNKYIFSVRCVFPIKNIVEEKKLVPGVRPSFKGFREDYLTDDDISEYYIWTWKNYFEATYLFVGSINEKLEIKPDTSVKPYIISGPTYNLQYKRGDDEDTMYIPFRTAVEDFRLYNYRGKIYIIDSAINQIRQLYVKNNKIYTYTKFDNICNIVFYNSNKTNRYNTDSYYKIYEKNWSLYKVDNNKERKEEKFYFLHDFSENGIEGVNYNAITEKCKNKILIPYKPNTFPKTGVFRYSFGSTTVFISDDNKKGYLGVGHIKIKFQQEKEDIENFTEDEKYYYDLFLSVHKMYRDTFGKKYKPHKTAQYYGFFFLYDSYSDKFYISDLFLPKTYSKDYYFTLIFPTAVVKKNNDVIVSMGYGDYTNILLKIPISTVFEKLKHDVSEMKVTDVKLELL